MTTDNDKAPEWMTDQFLRIVSGGGTEGDPKHFAREILRLRTENATLTAELATLKAHADHDAGEILRLGGELAAIRRENIEGGEEIAKTTAENVRLHAELAKVTADRDAKADRADRAEDQLRGCRDRVVSIGVERDAAQAQMRRAEAERAAALAEVDVTRRTLADTEAQRDAERQEAMQVRVSIEADLRAARAEVDRLNIEIGRHPATRAWVTSGIRAIEEATSRADAAIRDRNEFAASELERFCKDTLPPTGPLCGATTLDHAIRIRAAELRKAAGSVPAGERIRPFSEWSEFDGEALWFHLPVVESAFYVGRPDDSGWPYDGDPDGPDDSDQIGWVPVPRLASDGSELLRKAAPSTEGQSSILPLVRADGRTLRVGAIAGGAHPNDRRDGFPAELRLELGDVSRRHSCRYVRQAEGVSEGVSAGGCKAAGAAAPVGPSTNALIQGVGDAASDWCRCVCDYREACRDAPEDGSCDAVRESGRKCDIARGVLDKAIHALAGAAPVEFATTTTPGAFAFLANEPDVYATPAADARQPAGDSTRCRMIAQTIIAAIGSAGPENVEQSVDRLLRHLSETEKREADGIKLFDDLLATERAKVATMTIELDGMRNRIAASEKAKADHVVLVMNLRRALGMVRAKVGRVLGPQWEDNGHVGQVIRAAVELCAERAGGAS